MATGESEGEADGDAASSQPWFTPGEYLDAARQLLGEARRGVLRNAAFIILGAAWTAGVVYLFSTQDGLIEPAIIGGLVGIWWLAYLIRGYLRDIRIRRDRRLHELYGRPLRMHAAAHTFDRLLNLAEVNDEGMMSPALHRLLRAQAVKAGALGVLRTVNAKYLLFNFDPWAYFEDEKDFNPPRWVKLVFKPLLIAILILVAAALVWLILNMQFVVEHYEDQVKMVLFVIGCLPLMFCSERIYRANSYYRYVKRFRAELAQAQLRSTDDRTAIQQYRSGVIAALRRLRLEFAIAVNAQYYQNYLVLNPDALIVAFISFMALIRVIDEHPLFALAAWLIYLLLIFSMAPLIRGCYREYGAQRRAEFDQSGQAERLYCEDNETYDRKFSLATLDSNPILVAHSGVAWLPVEVRRIISQQSWGKPRFNFDLLGAFAGAFYVSAALGILGISFAFM